MASGQNVALEERQGKGMVDEAIKAGVKFFVYTSVDRGGSKSYDNPTNVPHFASKHNVEHHLVEKAEGTEMRWLILRPVAFFDNLTPSYFGKIFATALQVGLKGKPLQYIATSDIGHFAAQGFLKPEEYSGKSISLAGDSLTHDQMAAIFKEKTGKNFPSTFKFLANALLSMSKDMGAMFKWFHDEGYGADIDELKKVHPGLKDFSAWLEKDSQFMKR
jgi:nucleoside-diphosphate-sugar epimerase